MRALLISSIVCLLGALLVTACGGGGHGGGGGVPVTGGGPTPVQPVGSTAAIRPDVLTGASVPSVSLQDQKVHLYTFPATAGASFTVSFDTTPSGQTILLQVVEAIANGTSTPTANTLLSQREVTTPFTTTVTGTGDSLVNVFVFDEFQLGLTLSSLTVKLSQPQANTSTITAFVHIAGDTLGFTGLGAYNDLKTTTDQQQFVADLLNGVNALWAPTGVTINVAASGFRQLSTAQVQAADPGLVLSGFTIFDPGDGGSNVPGKNWGNLGIDATDPLFGNAVDIFIVHRSLPDSSGNDVLGFSSGVRLRGQGGIFQGRGTQHSLAFGLFDVNGTPRTVPELTKTLAHELGHFMSLMHPTDMSFQVDDLPDTPESTPAANDTDHDGKLTPADNIFVCPDVNNLMFVFQTSRTTQTTITADQARAVRAYLALRKH